MEPERCTEGYIRRDEWRNQGVATNQNTTQDNRQTHQKGHYTLECSQKSNSNNRRFPASRGPIKLCAKNADLRRYSMCPLRLSVSLAPFALLIIRSSSALFFVVQLSHLDRPTRSSRQLPIPISPRKVSFCSVYLYMHLWEKRDATSGQLIRVDRTTLRQRDSGKTSLRRDAMARIRWSAAVETTSSAKQLAKRISLLRKALLLETSSGVIYAFHVARN